MTVRLRLTMPTTSCFGSRPASTNIFLRRCCIARASSTPPAPPPTTISRDTATRKTMQPRVERDVCDAMYRTEMDMSRNGSKRVTPAAEVKEKLLPSECICCGDRAKMCSGDRSRQGSTSIAAVVWQGRRARALDDKWRSVSNHMSKVMAAACRVWFTHRV